MVTTFKVMLGNQVVHNGLCYQEAKENFLDWVEYMQENEVCYNSVTLTRNQYYEEAMLEYVNR